LTGSCLLKLVNGLWAKIGNEKTPNMTQPSFGFTLPFLLFSLLFFSNSYKLWFKTDSYYQDLYNSLTNERTPYPFKSFFLKRLESKQTWILWQKIFSLLGIVAVLAADVLVITALIIIES